MSENFFFQGRAMFHIYLIILCIAGMFECSLLDAVSSRTPLTQKKTVHLSVFTEQELDNTQVAITIVFKPNVHIPADGELNEFLPLEKHVGPFGRRFIASARQIKNALKLAGFDHWQTVAGEKFYAAAGRPTLPACVGRGRTWNFRS